MIYNKEETPFFSEFSKIDQIGIVDNDIEATLKSYEKIFGIEPFSSLESP
ncbi:MAG: hypothetical protein ACFE95_20235 [Candidatus Hodarchaeota archaeon]